MKKSTIAIIAVVAIVILWAISAYNGFISKEENVSNTWANIETAYQRRADLIPQLVNTVKGYASHEKSTLDAVVEARTKATQISIDTNDLSEENLRKFQNAQNAVGSALSRLIAISESYPDLKASENFSELQAQLEGTENRIAEARKRFNATVKEYNISIRRFPNNILSGMFGFERKAEFRSAEDAEKAPEVNFD